MQPYKNKGNLSYKQTYRYVGRETYTYKQAFIQANRRIDIQTVIQKGSYAIIHIVRQVVI